MSKSARVVRAAVLSVMGLVSPLFPMAGQVTTEAYETYGVRVLHRRDPSSQVVATRLYLLGGTALLTPETEGVETLWLRAARTSARSELSASGGRSVLAASPDWSCTGFVTLREYWTEAWEVWAASLMDPSRWGGAFEGARSLALSDARGARADPEQRVLALLNATAFEEHPYELDAWGTVESLTDLTPQAATEFVDEHSVRSRMLLVVVGEVERVDIEMSVRSSLASLPLGRFEGIAAWTAKEQENQFRGEDRPMPTSYLGSLVIGPPPGDGAYYAFELATYLLSSRLHQVLRREESLSYAAFATFHPHATPFTTIQVSTSDPARAYPLVLRQMEWLLTVAQMPRQVLSLYLDQFVLDELRTSLSPDSQAEALAHADLYLGGYDMAERRLEALRRVTLQDIQRVARDYFPRFHTAYVGDGRLIGNQ